MDFWTSHRKREALAKAEANGQIADSLEFRKELIKRMQCGEITIAESQRLLAQCKRNASKNGKTTRDKAFREG